MSYNISVIKKRIKLSIILPLVLLISLIGLLGYKLGKSTSQSFLNKEKQDTPTSVDSSSTQAVRLLIENPELYVDKQKSISFVFPSDTHIVKVDSESERSRAENSDIPHSFLTVKGFSAPKVLWALKVEEKKPFQGRYGMEAQTVPFAVWVFDNSQNLTIDDWFEAYWYYPFTWGSASESEIVKMRPMAKIMIDGEQAAGYDRGPTPRGYLKLYYIGRNDKMYLFQLLGEEENSLDFEIASTFKFLLPIEYSR